MKTFEKHGHLSIKWKGSGLKDTRRHFFWHVYYGKEKSLRKRTRRTLVDFMETDGGVVRARDQCVWGRWGTGTFGRRALRINGQRTSLEKSTQLGVGRCNKTVGTVPESCCLGTAKKISTSKWFCFINCQNPIEKIHQLKKIFCEMIKCAMEFQPKISCSRRLHKWKFWFRFG